jgi:hypothetical protein
MSPTVEDRCFLFAPCGGARGWPRPERLLSCRPRGARARARFGFSWRGDRLRDSAPCSRSVWYPVSLPARHSCSALALLAASMSLTRLRDRASRPRSRAVLTGACLARRFTRARARRARPPPFAPRGAASPVAPRGAASPSSFGGISREMSPTAQQITMFEDDASGRPAMSHAGSTESTWGGTRRRPRSIRPISAAHGFSFQR